MGCAAIWEWAASPAQELAARLPAPRGSAFLRGKALWGAALGILICVSACGAKTGLFGESLEVLEGLPDCQAEGETRECRSVCGAGVETCIEGEWQLCDAERPKPPKLKAVVRDFRDAHPDFEQHDGFSGRDLGIVQFDLGADDKPVYAGNPNTPSTTSRRAFDQWYHESDESIALSTEIELAPDPNDPELYVFQNSAFFPVDDQGFGNQGRPHNYHFTLELRTAFRYVGGETFAFSGDDDLWVFINRRLAIDIGGRHTQLSDKVNLDEVAEYLALELGETYPLHLFFAERHTVSSNFNIATTIAEFEFCD